MSDPNFQIFGGAAVPSRREFTVREYAKNEQVTERTVWNWIDKKAVEYRKTPGGGVRIVVTENR